MNKKQLIRYIASCAGVSQAQARKFLDCYFKAINGVVRRGDRVTLRGFGSYNVGSKDATKKFIRFKPGKSLKDSLK